MSRRAHFKEADVSRALRAATKLGLKPSGYRIDPVTGAIEVQLAEVAQARGNTFDAIIGAR